MARHTVTAADLIHALGGDLRNGMCRCPCHDDRTPSLHISDVGGKLFWHCHAGCSQETLLAEFQRRGFFSSVGEYKMNRETAEARDKRREATEKENDRFFKGVNILRVAAYSKEPPPEAYFRSRGLGSVPKNARVLPTERASQLTGWAFPAVVFPITDGEFLTGAHVTFLTEDGVANARGANGKSVRLTFGLVKRGYIIFGPSNPDKPLLVAEGVESALSAAVLTDLPAIAAISAGNMAAINPPPCSELIICGDDDASGTGRKAAEAAAAQWAHSGRKVRIAIPTDHKDWNDVLRDRVDRDAMRHAILSAPVVDAPELATVEGVVLSMEEVITMKVPPREYLLKPWLETQSLGMIHAQRGAGKTRLMMSVAYTIASAGTLLGWEAQRQARVLYIDGELPTALLQKRLAVLGTPTPDLKILSRDILLRRGVSLPDLADPAGREFLDQLIKEWGIEVVFLDSLSTLIRSGAHRHRRVAVASPR
jgi:putative DNA primase/helicase